MARRAPRRELRQRHLRPSAVGGESSARRRSPRGTGAFQPGYPLGPHSLVDALGSGLGLRLDLGFTALLIATLVIIALVGSAALRGEAGWKRVVTGVLAALFYLVAAYYAEGAFKEPLLAVLLLAFVLQLEEVREEWATSTARPVWRPGSRVAVLAAGAIYVYSYPAVAWLGLTLALWLAGEAICGSRAGGGTGGLELRALLAPVAAAGGVLVAPAGAERRADPELRRLDRRLGGWHGRDSVVEPGQPGLPAVALRSARHLDQPGLPADSDERLPRRRVVGLRPRSLGLRAHRRHQPARVRAARRGRGVRARLLVFEGLPVAVCDGQGAGHRRSGGGRHWACAACWARREARSRAGLDPTRLVAAAAFVAPGALLERPGAPHRARVAARVDLGAHVPGQADARTDRPLPRQHRLRGVVVQRLEDERAGQQRGLDGPGGRSAQQTVRVRLADRFRLGGSVDDQSLPLGGDVEHRRMPARRRRGSCWSGDCRMYELWERVGVGPASPGPGGVERARRGAQLPRPAGPSAQPAARRGGGDGRCRWSRRCRPSSPATRRRYRCTCRPADGTSRFNTSSAMPVEIDAGGERWRMPAYLDRPGPFFAVGPGGLVGCSASGHDQGFEALVASPAARWPRSPAHWPRCGARGRGQLCLCAPPVAVTWIGTRLQ